LYGASKIVGSADLPSTRMVEINPREGLPDPLAFYADGVILR
jgi:hypothetical protein